MMITVTAASGQLGALVIEALLSSGVPASEIVAAVRNPDKAAGLATRGVQVREADYSKPETLATALADTDRLLLISGSEVGQRVEQHGNVVKAAVAADVSLIAYTSIVNADTSGIALADEHKATEALIRESGLPYVLLRNSMYMEMHTDNVATALQTGVIMGAAGDGLFSAATRADFAAAAAAVLTGAGHENAVYELGGDEPYTTSQLAAEIAAQSGKPVAYQDMPGDEYAKVLAGFGLPEALADLFAESDVGAARGDWHTTSRDLSTLIGRPTTTLAQAVSTALDVA
jgi:NAD(P)H dehydrogenase (quinone)